MQKNSMHIILYFFVMVCDMSVVHAMSKENQDKYVLAGKRIDESIRIRKEIEALVSKKEAERRPLTVRERVQASRLIGSFASGVFDMGLKLFFMLEIDKLEEYLSNGQNINAIRSTFEAAERYKYYWYKPEIIARAKFYLDDFENYSVQEHEIEQRVRGRQE